MSVYKRFNGKKVVRGNKNYDKGTWYYRFKIAGRLYHQSIPEAQTMKDAEIAETAVKQKLFNNKFNPSADKTLFADFVDRVYLPYAEQNNADKVSKRIYARLLKDFFRNRTLREITPHDCRNYQYFRQRTKKKNGEFLAAASVNREMTTLSKIFTLAMQEELVDRNPCSLVKKLPEAAPRDRILTEDEQVRFWTEVYKDELLTQIVTLAVNTGLRKGQILAIRAADVDFENKRLKAAASKGKGARFVPLNESALRVLKKAAEHRPDFLFVSQRTDYQLTRFEKRWRKCLKDANIKNFRFHDTRHLFATDLLKNNVHPVYVKGLLGHSEIKMSEIYMNTDFESLRDAVASLDPKVQESEGVN